MGQKTTFITSLLGIDRLKSSSSRNVLTFKIVLGMLDWVKIK